ncbi:hypothetical protein [Henriciella marina]|uniref:Uncharacterized protein n=1 Tax=Henriciella marina TaxID=453851 RepID=A0ABT4LVG0_9PROT|nr:hypothetical protein [Henriciella marina]MCZ4298363.1 hypothetical protein [Henriciella marina]
MLTRAWILETLAKLPVWTWPLFLFEVWAVERYYRAYRAANPIGIMGVAVLPNGRIVITLQVSGQPQAQQERAELAPRAPWLRLAPGAGIAAFADAPAKHRPDTVGTPCVDLQNTALQPARPLAPP